MPEKREWTQEADRKSAPREPSSRRRQIKLASDDESVKAFQAEEEEGAKKHRLKKPEVAKSEPQRTR